MVVVKRASLSLRQHIEAQYKFIANINNEKINVTHFSLQVIKRYFPAVIDSWKLAKK